MLKADDLMSGGVVNGLKTGQSFQNQIQQFRASSVSYLGFHLFRPNTTKIKGGLVNACCIAFTISDAHYFCKRLMKEVRYPIPKDNGRTFWKLLESPKSIACN